MKQVLNLTKAVFKEKKLRTAVAICTLFFTSGCVGTTLQNMTKQMSPNAGNIANTSKTGKGSTNKLPIGSVDLFKIKKEHKGYAKDYQPVKGFIYAGNRQEAIKCYSKTVTSSKSFFSKNSNESVSPNNLGIAKAVLNVRSVPKGKALGKIPAKAKMTIAEEKDGWLLIASTDKNKKEIKGWVSGKYVTRIEQVSSLDFSQKSLKILNNMELGALHLDEGNVKKSRDHIQQCLDELKMVDSEGQITSSAKKGSMKVLEWASGNAELQPYDPAGYEKVMLLNYKAIDYLLDGEHKAFNVARRAIDWQNMERKKFSEEIKKSKKELKKEEKKITKKEQPAKGKPNLGLTKSISNIKELFTSEYSKNHQKASQVSSAYVNPFSDYLIGAIMEFEALEDSSKIDDAKRAYGKASALNSKSQLLKKAAKELSASLKKGTMRSDKNLLHVVVFDGFAPEVKILSTKIPVYGEIITVQAPKLEAIDSDVKTIKLLSSGGKVLAIFDTIANMEAMVLRHQKDSEPAILLNVVSMIARSALIQKGAGSLLGGFGKFAGSAIDDLAHPDTRTWGSLPATIRAARVYLPKGTKVAKLVTYNKKGRQISSSKINLIPDGHNFVYARSLNNNITAHSAKKLWVNR